MCGGSCLHGNSQSVCKLCIAIVGNRNTSGCAATDPAAIEATAGVVVDRKLDTRDVPEVLSDQDFNSAAEVSAFGLTGYQVVSRLPLKLQSRSLILFYA